MTQPAPQPVAGPPTRKDKAAVVKLWRYSGLEAATTAWLRMRAKLPASVLLFHRVTDEIPEDPITISTARFRMLMRHVREHYNPVTLTQLLAFAEKKAQWPARTVVITFDDGYLDNFAYAAPILAEFGLPAMFYVVADAIGSDWVMPWDTKLPKRLPWMNWEQVRQLQASGFEIGSHTVTHPDLGVLRGEEAQREIFESKQKIEEKLGVPVPHFAYPFGRRRNFLEENRELVRRAGYRSCSAVVNGVFEMESDPFDILRIPVDSSFRGVIDLDFELRTSTLMRLRRNRNLADGDY